MIYLLSELYTLFFIDHSKEDIIVLIWYFSFSIMIFLSRKKKRIRGLFLILPIMGIVSSVEMIPVMIWMIITGSSYDYNSQLIPIIDLIINSILFVIFILWFKKYKPLQKRSELGIWERRIINGNGLLLFIIYAIVLSIPDALESYIRYLLLVCIIIAIMIIATSILMTTESANAKFYKTIAEMNEHYLEAQLNHFKAYQETQLETRRIRHDMKNHIICINDLFLRKENDKLAEYLRDLSELTQNIDRELHIGNDIADAILNEKYAVAKSHGIQLHIDGSLSGIETISPLDLCTIFSNAIDNAIEATKKIDTMISPVIFINVKRNKKLLFLSFRNPCNEILLKHNNVLITTKKDTTNHGFGLNNIRMTTEKYNGTMKYSITTTEDNHKIFDLEIMLMI